MIRVGIVGHEEKKFTWDQKQVAKKIIKTLLDKPGTVLVSGRSPLGGIDVWAEEVALELGKPMVIFPPVVNSWEMGYKPRNKAIANESDELHCIVVEELPDGFDGPTYPDCYHCKDKRPKHVKSGGCWTLMQVPYKTTYWHIIPSNVRTGATKTP